MLGSIRDVLSKRLPFEYSRPVIFANLSRSRNSRNKGRAKISGFTVILCTNCTHNFSRPNVEHNDIIIHTKYSNKHSKSTSMYTLYLPAVNRSIRQQSQTQYRRGQPARYGTRCHHFKLYCLISCFKQTHFLMLHQSSRPSLQCRQAMT